MAVANSPSVRIPWSEELAARVARQRQAIRERANDCRAKLNELQKSILDRSTTTASPSALNEGIAELAELEHELDLRARKLSDGEAQIRRDQHELEQRIAQVAEEAAEAQRLKSRWQDRTAKLDEEFEAVETEKARTILQRRRIAEQFRSDRHARGDSGESEKLRLQQRQLQEERDLLRESLHEAQAALQRAKESAVDESDAGAAGELAVLRGKYDMAMTDIRELRKRNAELETKAARAMEAAPIEAQDWESQKRRMLAALEAEETSENIGSERRDERLTIEGTIQITDDMISEKEREIADLKRLLDEQSQNLGHIAVGAAAIGQILDNDEVVQQERQRLQQRETDLLERLRLSEIELSRERAQIARHRVELDEQRRQIDLDRSKMTPRDEAVARKGGSGNWLARLGLKADGE